MFGESIWLWVGFNAMVLGLLALDLGVFHRKAHVVKAKEAAIWTVVWITLALAFNAVVYVWRGPEPALEYLTGYVIEKSLSVDNIFVFVIIFSTFSVPAAYQHRVLFWGILGALVMRGAMIAAGAALLEQFHWIVYLFGAFLIFTGIRMAVQREVAPHPERNPLLRLARRLFPVTEGYEGQRFFVRRAGKLMATPLLLVLLVVETTDLVFAVDSIPAVFAVTRDPFIVYTSNVFAILGLRALYFLLANAVGKFYYLKPALSVVLVFVGVKMLLAEVYKIPIVVSLGVIATVLGIAMVASWIRARRLAGQRITSPRPDVKAISEAVDS
ncbi:MAG: TerC family protein [Chloroflexota bacterium]|nr:TerC family protein [Chloroflexota bacterium]